MPIVKETELRRRWKNEVKKRQEFGIAKEIFFNSIGKSYFCAIKFQRDFDSLVHYYNFCKKNKKPSNNDSNVIDAYKKYVAYTFKQISEAGGTLQLSKTCGFVYSIIRNNIEYKDIKIVIFHRVKDAINSKNYPEKVRALFDQDRKCMGVAFLCNVALTRTVLIEKKKYRAKK